MSPHHVGVPDLPILLIDNRTAGAYIYHGLCVRLTAVGPGKLAAGQACHRLFGGPVSPRQFGAAAEEFVWAVLPSSPAGNLPSTHAQPAVRPSNKPLTPVLCQNSSALEKVAYYTVPSPGLTTFIGAAVLYCGRAMSLSPLSGSTPPIRASCFLAQVFHCGRVSLRTRSARSWRVFSSFMP